MAGELGTRKTIGVRPTSWQLQRRSIGEANNHRGSARGQHVELLTFERMVASDDR